MRIDILRNRENFEIVLEQSMIEFIKTFSQKKIEFNWINGNGSEFLIFDKLNLILPANCPTNIMKMACQEYAESKNFFKSIAQLVYINLVSTYSLRSFFSSQRFYLKKLPSELKNLIILPGNSSFRILDFKRKKSIVFKKENYSSFEKIIKVRTSYLPEISPCILEHNTKKSWYVEDLINASPINRIKPSNKRYNNSIIEACNILQKLKNKTNTYVKLDLWLNQKELKKSQFQKKYSSILTSKLKLGLIGKLLNSIKWYIKSSEYSSLQIELCQSHGDFQGSNILFDRLDLNKHFLIDWEFTDTRVWFYDYLVFYLMARERGINFNKWKNERWFSLPKDIQFKILAEKNKFGTGLFLLIFVLEEFQFRCEEASKVQHEQINKCFRDLMMSAAELNFKIIK